MTGHHSNRLGGSRGISKPEDALNLMIQLTRPEGYTADQGAEFVVSFEKSRGVHGAAVAPFRARLTDTGWTTEPMENETASAASPARCSSISAWLMRPAIVRSLPTRRPARSAGTDSGCSRHGPIF